MNKAPFNQKGGVSRDLVGGYIFTGFGVEITLAHYRLIISLIVTRIISVMRKTNPATFTTISSFLLKILFPKSLWSDVKRSLPPSSAGKGMVFNTAKFKDISPR